MSDTKTIVKVDTGRPALVVTGASEISIRGGTAFNGVSFQTDTPVVIDVPLEPGGDYGVIVNEGAVGYARLQSGALGADVLGGFHFAPGGNAGARQGGDAAPAINPHSLWDVAFRPACPDPRGMALVDASCMRFWCDIYLTNIDHLAAGTSRLGLTIADGEDLPNDPTGGRFRRFDYAAACAVMKHHGKGLLGIDEFFAAAFGVTEKSSADDEPSVTQLDASRTSKWGIIQATGNMWIWGHDGDPDEPRPSLFGGAWLYGSGAGSRCADLGDWPERSGGGVGARGRSDHLQLD
jgi:hypothetical protein